MIVRPLFIQVISFWTQMSLLILNCAFAPSLHSNKFFFISKMSLHSRSTQVQTFWAQIISHALKCAFAPSNHLNYAILNFNMHFTLKPLKSCLFLNSNMSLYPQITQIKPSSPLICISPLNRLNKVLLYSNVLLHFSSTLISPFDLRYVFTPSIHSSQILLSSNEPSFLQVCLCTFKSNPLQL